MQVVLSSTVADLDAAVAALDLAVDDRDLAAARRCGTGWMPASLWRCRRWTPLHCGMRWGRRR